MPPLNKKEIEFWKDDSERSTCYFVPEQPLKFPSRRRTRRVHFDDQINTKPVLPLNEYTNNEIKDSWYCIADFSRFREDIETTVHLIHNRPKDVDDLLYTSRGAEYRLADVTERRRRLRSQARSAVLSEQEFQRAIGDNNDEKIAAVYSQTSTLTMQDAIDLAAADKIDANQYQSEECQKEAFSDDWIRSVSTKYSCSHAHHRVEESNEWDVSGFDDSWIREVAGPLVCI